MKRIGIDARLYSQTGVGIYIKNLLYYLATLSTEDFTFYIYVLSDDNDKISLPKNFIKRIANYRWHSFAEQIGFLFQLYKDNLNLMHFTYFSHPILYSRPFVSTIHDLILLEHKTGKASTHSSFFYNLKHLAFIAAFNHQISKSIRIITPTEYIKQQIVKRCGEDCESKIITVYEGIDYKKLTVQQNQGLAQQFTKPFLLYVGNFYPHKNVENLIKAFSSISEDIELVLVGPSDYFTNKIKSSIKEHKQEGRVTLYTNASDSDLIYFYKNAKALVHPSLSEGFGLPLVEAAYFNLPIIASDIPVFKEILGKSYLSFNPNDFNDISDKLDLALKQKAKPDYQDILKKFSFKKMSQEILEIYKVSCKE